MQKLRTAVTALALAMTGVSGGAFATTTTFSDGDEGWTGNAYVDDSVGAPAPGFHTTPDVIIYGLSWRNENNPAFIGDYTSSSSVTISLDVLTNSIVYLGTFTEVPRNLFVKLTDVGDPDDFTDNVSLYYQLGTIAASPDWQHLSVTIGDTSATGLPDGWIGVDGDGNTTLPPDRSFTDILAHVGTIEFTTFEPEMFYGDTLFDVIGDNFTVTRGDAGAVPEPASWAMMIFGLGAVGASLRRRRTSVAFAR